MVENVVDDGVEPKPAIIEDSINASVYVKPIVEGSVDVKIPIQASVKISFQAYVEAKPNGVSKLHDYEVNTASLFLTNDRWRERDDLLG